MPGPYPPYPSGPFSHKFAIGGAGGTNFLSVAQTPDGKFTGSTVEKISVWTNSNCLQGVRIMYNDAGQTRSPMYGRDRGDLYEYVFAPGEKITGLTLWGNGVGTRVGRIAFTTRKTDNGAGSFDHGKDTSGQSAYPMPDIGSGVLMGIFGRSGSEVDALGLIFLAKVDSIVITDVKYNLPDIYSDQGNIYPVTVDQVTYTYGGSPSTWTFAGTQERSEATTFTQSAGLTYGQSVTVKAGIPLLADVEGTASWSISATFTQETSTTSDHALHWGLSGSLNSSADNVRCQAICKYGFLPEVSYTATVNVKMLSGESFSFFQSGKLSRTQYTNVVASSTKIGVSGTRKSGAELNGVSISEGLDN